MKDNISLESLTLKARNKDTTSVQSSEARSGYQIIIAALDTTLASLEAAQALNQHYMGQVITKHSMLKDEKSKWANIFSKVAYVHKSAELLQTSEFTNSRIEIFKRILYVINEGTIFQGREGVTAELKGTLEALNVVNGWKSEETSDLKKLLPMMEALVNDVEAANEAGGEKPKPLELEDVGWSDFVASIDRQVHASKQELEVDIVG